MHMQSCRVFFDVVIPTGVMPTPRANIKQSVLNELVIATTQANRFHWYNMWGLDASVAGSVDPALIKTFLLQDVAPDVAPSFGPIATLQAVDNDTYCFSGEDRVCYHGFEATLQDAGGQLQRWEVWEDATAYPILLTLTYRTTVFPDDQP